jgi:hypothetical protein
MTDDALSVRTIAPIAAMKALVRDGILSGGDTVLVFRRSGVEWYDVIVGPDKQDNYVQANVWLHTDVEYACSCGSTMPLRQTLEDLESTRRHTIAAEIRAQRAYDGKPS